MTKYMVMQTYSGGEACDAPMSEWSPEDIRVHIAFQRALNEELTDKGELVDAQGLAGPEAAKKVVSGGAGGTVVTDGPFTESKELLAGTGSSTSTRRSGLWRSPRGSRRRPGSGARRSASRSRSAR
ncbi:hypothetical protein AB0878_43090 [Amycolatopsis sp. NPDC047767]|uniref:YciI family protein n=1 Tax=Amycolatopsis sp. NPDC047767 TaxID=3156765 RepID=UPI0034556FB7